IMCDPQPKLLGLSWQLPFRCETGQPDFAFRVLFAGAFGIMPDGFSLGPLLFRLLSGIRLVGEAQIFKIAPVIAFGPAAQTRPILLRAESICHLNRRWRSSGFFRRQFLPPAQYVGAHATEI